RRSGSPAHRSSRKAARRSASRSSACWNSASTVSGDGSDMFLPCLAARFCERGGRRPRSQKRAAKLIDAGWGVAGPRSQKRAAKLLDAGWLKSGDERPPLPRFPFLDGILLDVGHRSGDVLFRVQEHLPQLGGPAHWHPSVRPPPRGKGMQVFLQEP